MPSIKGLDRELKKGSAELIILSILEARPRHGYEIGKLIETRSRGELKFHAASLYPLLYRLEERGWLQGKWVEKAGQRRRRFYTLTPKAARPREPARDLEGVRACDGIDHGRRPCLIGPQEIRSRLESLRVDAAREADVVDELSQHLDERYEELKRAGASDDDGASQRARRAARARRADGAHAAPEASAVAAAAAVAERERLVGCELVARFALRGARAAQAAALRDRDRADTRARHRREHGDLQPRERDVAHAVAGGRARPARVRAIARQRRRSRIRATRRCATATDTFDGFAAWGGIAVSFDAGDSPSSSKATSSPAISST